MHGWKIPAIIRDLNLNHYGAKALRNWLTSIWIHCCLSLPFLSHDITLENAGFKFDGVNRYSAKSSAKGPHVSRRDVISENELPSRFSSKSTTNPTTMDTNGSEISSYLVFQDRHKNEPHFDNLTSRNVTTSSGKIIFLPCRVYHLGDRTVSRFPCILGSQRPNLQNPKERQNSQWKSRSYRLIHSALKIALKIYTNLPVIQVIH